MSTDISECMNNTATVFIKIIMKSYRRQGPLSQVKCALSSGIVLGLFVLFIASSDSLFGQDVRRTVGDDNVPVARIDLSENEKEDAEKGADGLPEGEELVNISFPEPTEIKDIIKAVSLWTGKNIILDNNIRGRVQIISPRKVTTVEAYQIFLSALSVLDLTLVETGKVAKIMNQRKATKGSLKTYMGKWTPKTDQVITQIIPLRYIDARDVQATLSKIVTANAMVSYEPTNTLIISDTGYKIKRVLEILEILDVKTQQPQVEIVPIRYGDAKEISKKVQEIFKAGQGKKSRERYHSYKIMTDDRSNSVIIFGPPRTITDVKALVKKFDIEIEDPSRQNSIHVRMLEYADAKKIASTLSSLASGSSKSSSTIRRPPIRSRTSRSRRSTSTSSEPSVADLGDNVKITADESTNSLLITGSRSAYNALDTIIRKLDSRRSQVYVEAEIIDINQSNNFDFGTSIFAGYGKESGTKFGTAWQARNVAPLVIANADANNENAPTTSAEAASVFADDLTIGILSGQSVTIPGIGTFTPAGLIKMIKADSNSRVVASPHLLTSNNEEAQFTVGEKVFYPSAQVNATTGTAVAKPESEDVDLVLSLKPNISHSDYITLTLEVESNTVLDIDGETKLPRIGKRKTKQVVSVKNQQTVVISGLVQHTEQEAYNKIPLLGDIPILGWLFRNSQLIKRRSNLMIFLTPNIVHGANDLASIYKEKIAERDDFLENLYGSDYQDTEFYSYLAKEEDGLYRDDSMDEAERQRLQGTQNTPSRNSGGGNVEENNEPVNIPFGSTTYDDDDGGSDFDGGGDEPEPEVEPEPPSSEPVEEPSFGDDE